MKYTAYNGRFCKMAAVTPQKVQCEHERKYPAERLVSAAASPSRCLVIGKRRTAQKDTENETR